MPEWLTIASCAVVSTPLSSTIRVIVPNRMDEPLPGF